MIADAEVLVADDEADIVCLLQDVLEEQGYRVRTARDGSSALLAIEEKPPVLVLLDNAMPVMSGLEVLLRLRAGGFATLPIIMMSAATTAEQCLRFGATDFLAKPFNLD